MGLGVMFTLSVYLIQHSLIDEIIQTAPPGVPNVYLVGVTADQATPLRELISRQQGILNAPQLSPSVAARIVRIDGEDVATRTVRGPARRYQNTRNVTWESSLPSELVVQEGKWWAKGTTEPVVSVAQDTATALDLHPGAQIEWEIAGRMLTSKVVAVHEIDGMRSTAPSEFVFNPEALAGFPVVFYGGVRIEPSQAGALQRVIFEKYPTVTVVNVADVLQTVQQIIDQIALVIRFLSAFAILAGAIILAASVAGSRFRRIREVVILKTLGGTRRHIARIFSIEFVTLGAVAGLMGSLLASAFSRILLTRLLDAKFQLDAPAILVSVALTALLANVAGWFASIRILRQKPLEVLREE
jgi:putative ABC transport system permease protein